MRNCWTLLLLFVNCLAFAQGVFLRGKVLDKINNHPLPYANVMLLNKATGAVSDDKGEFSISISPGEVVDTVVVSYIGYKTLKKKWEADPLPMVLFLEQYPVLLDEVSISGIKFQPSEVIKSFRVIRDKLFASNTEVTNSQYNLFLRSLRESNLALNKKYDYDLSSYNEDQRLFFKRYQTEHKKRKKTHDSTFNYNDYPAVNISHAAALAYCEWLTEEYNSSLQKKKYKRVKFRLPSLDEWRIAALGSPTFQSWKPEENFVMVALPKDSLEDIGSGKKVKLMVKDEVLYPWYAYNVRKKAQNSRHCFLGNFKVPANATPCIIPKPSFDGYGVMGETATYFPNNIGLYDVVGNVAEMIDEPGKACGGSWDDHPDKCTIWSVSNYSMPRSTVGFRVFMEIIER